MVPSVSQAHGSIQTATEAKRIRSGLNILYERHIFERLNLKNGSSVFSGIFRPEEGMIETWKTRRGVWCMSFQGLDIQQSCEAV